MAVQKSKEDSKNTAGQVPTQTQTSTGTSRAARFLQSGRGSSLTDIVRKGVVPGVAPEHRADEPGVIWVPIDHILPSPFQHEEQIDPSEYQGLVSSMRTTPYPIALNVNEIPERPSYYFLTSGGHQRLKAAKEAGRTKMAVFVEPPLSRLELAMRAVKENAFRVNRSMVNMGHLFLQMLDEFPDLNQHKIADMLEGKGRSYVEYCINAAKSEPDIQEIFIDRPDSVKAMIYLRRIKPKSKKPTKEEIEEARALRAPIIARYRAGEIDTKGVEIEVNAVLAKRDNIPSSEQSLPDQEITTKEGKNTQDQSDASSLSSTEGSEASLLPSVSSAPEEEITQISPSQATSSQPGDLPSTSISARPTSPASTSATIPHEETDGQIDPHLTKRIGRAEDARSRLLSYLKLVTKQQQITEKERSILSEMVSLLIPLLLDLELMQELERLAAIREGSQGSHPDIFTLVQEAIQALLESERATLASSIQPVS